MRWAAAACCQNELASPVCAATGNMRQADGTPSTPVERAATLRAMFRSTAWHPARCTHHAHRFSTVEVKQRVCGPACNGHFVSVANTCARRPSQAHARLQHADRLRIGTVLLPIAGVADVARKDLRQKQSKRPPQTCFRCHALRCLLPEFPCRRGIPLVTHTRHGEDPSHGRLTRTDRARDTEVV